MDSYLMSTAAVQGTQEDRIVFRFVEADAADLGQSALAGLVDDALSRIVAVLADRLIDVHDGPDRHFAFHKGQVIASYLFIGKKLVQQGLEDHRLGIDHQAAGLLIQTMDRIGSDIVSVPVIRSDDLA